MERTKTPGDFHMPVMDGLEATREIKARYPEVQVIVHTSADNPATSGSSQRRGRAITSKRATSNT
jgi:CheY-like chemotaxis protein